MRASIHIADVGAGAAVRALRRSPSAREVKGLRHAHLALAAQLTGRVPLPALGRCALIAFWENDDALDEFLARDPLAQLLADGFRVRLKPLRASGRWPGLPLDTPSARSTDHEGPLAALTLGRLRFTQAVRFLRASARAEASLLRASGVLWATGLAAPPLVSTFSFWHDARALASYAYGRSDPAHADAIAAAAAKPFHHESAFIRFQPYAAEGRLTGKNPFSAELLQQAADPERRADRVGTA